MCSNKSSPARRAYKAPPPRRAHERGRAARPPARIKRRRRAAHMSAGAPRAEVPRAVWERLSTRGKERIVRLLARDNMLSICDGCHTAYTHDARRLVCALRFQQQREFAAATAFVVRAGTRGPPGECEAAKACARSAARGLERQRAQRGVQAARDHDGAQLASSA